MPHSRREGHSPSWERNAPWYQATVEPIGPSHGTSRERIFASVCECWIYEYVRCSPAWIYAVEFVRGRYQCSKTQLAHFGVLVRIGMHTSCALMGLGPNEILFPANFEVRRSNLFVFFHRILKWERAIRETTISSGIGRSALSKNVFTNIWTFTSSSDSMSRKR